jgi:tetratricopeptide (TPR) repeat protein
MRVAVYTVALNEADHVARWAESAKDADMRFVLDTGSSDDTEVQCYQQNVAVARCSVRPWRFDDARNAALAMLPANIDMCISLDMDEVLLPGWREALESAPPADRHTHTLVTGEVAFAAERCHSRFNWRWQYPIHEIIQWTGEGVPKVADGGFVIKHQPDNSKSRGQYLDLLARAAAENPDDARLAHYYGRELFFRGKWALARELLMRHINMPSSLWADERCQSYRYLAKMDYHPERWLLKAAAEAPHRREPWVDLAKFYQGEGRMQEAAGMAQRALSIDAELRPKAYMSENDAWDDAFVGQFLGLEVR